MSIMFSPSMLSALPGAPEVPSLPRLSVPSLLVAACPAAAPVVEGVQVAKEVADTAEAVGRQLYDDDEETSPETLARTAQRVQRTAVDVKTFGVKHFGGGTFDA